MDFLETHENRPKLTDHKDQRIVLNLGVFRVCSVTLFKNLNKNLFFWPGTKCRLVHV